MIHNRTDESTIHVLLPWFEGRSPMDVPWPDPSNIRQSTSNRPPPPYPTTRDRSTRDPSHPTHRVDRSSFNSFNSLSRELVNSGTKRFLTVVPSSVVVLFVRSSHFRSTEDRQMVAFALRRRQWNRFASIPSDGSGVKEKNETESWIWRHESLKSSSG
jgi:hypothetical protein